MLLHMYKNTVIWAKILKMCQFFLLSLSTSIAVKQHVIVFVFITTCIASHQLVSLSSHQLASQGTPFVCLV